MKVTLEYEYSSKPIKIENTFNRQIRGGLRMGEGRDALSSPTKGSLLCYYFRISIFGQNPKIFLKAPIYTYFVDERAPKNAIFGQILPLSAPKTAVLTSFLPPLEKILAPPLPKMLRKIILSKLLRAIFSYYLKNYLCFILNV